MQKYYSPFTHAELLEKVRKIRHVALDMDGTIYLGAKLFPFTLAFLNGLKEMGIGYSFLTNNPSRSMADYLAKLRNMGIPAEREEMFNTAVATIQMIQKTKPEAKHLFILGTKSMISEFEAAGFTLASEDPNDEPDAVVVAFDTELTYSKLCRAAWWISKKKPYFATNPDFVCPTDLPTVLVDCGSLCACLEAATGRKPDIMMGKPDPKMLDGIVERYGLKSDEIAMAGDRIYTDIAMARNAGALGVLVLTGETTLETALGNDPQPDITAQSLVEFGELIREAQKN